MYGSASHILTAGSIKNLKINGAYKDLKGIFISAIKRTLQLPPRGAIAPIEELFH